MKNVVVALVTLIASSVAQAQQAVQWRVQDGGNGHWYRFNRVPGGICWSSSRIAAEQGGGHLVTITSAAENSFVIAYTDANNPGVFTGGPYLGATCENAPWGQWRWVTGEPFVFTGWDAGEPNSGGNERYVHLWRWGSLWWNDTSECGADSYIVEWSADCNNDGIVDYGQCRDGSLPDYNGNNIPDCCESGTPCVVGNYPVQWRVQDGGNGHWYAISSGYSGWAVAREDALRVGADLAGMETNSEWLWARSWIPSILHGYWLGARQQPFSPSPSEGWYWLTGTPVAQYWMIVDDNPCGASPPGVEDMQQDFLHTCCENYPQGRSWGDLDDLGGWGCDISLRALVEWSADCNNDGIVDIGQIYLQPELFADANSNGIPDICEVDPCPGDITGGGFVDAIDLSILLAFWGSTGGGEFDADVNNDGIVEGADLSIVLTSWGPCPN